jgi:predicted porin
MKKLALAALLSVSFALAQAQSNVAVYGIIDTGYIGTNYTGISGSATSKQNTNGFGNNAENASRLGFRGTEDLGGGTSVIFTIETGLNPDAATLSGFNNRQSFVGLKQNGLGQAAVGLQYTPIHKAVGQTDPGNQNNMMGDVIFTQSPQANGNSGSAPYASASSSSGETDGYTVRVANALTATSESFSGVTVTGLMVMNNQNQTQTSATAGGTTNYSGYGLGVNYEWHQLLLTANYQALKSYASAATLTSPTPAIWSAAGGGANTQDNQTYLAAKYDFGQIKAYAQYLNRSVTDAINSSYWANRSAQAVGLRGSWTPVVESWVSIGTGKVTAFGGNQPTANFHAFQLGTDYFLSKRTNLYAIYGQSQTTATTTIAGLSGSNYAVGIQHKF